MSVVSDKTSVHNLFEYAQSNGISNSFIDDLSSKYQKFGYLSVKQEQSLRKLLIQYQEIYRLLVDNEKKIDNNNFLLSLRDQFMIRHSLSPKQIFVLKKILL